MIVKTLAVCALLAFQDGAKTETSGVERLLRATPEDAAVVLSTHDFDSIRAQLEGNSWWKFAHEESMQGWMESLWASLESETPVWGNVDGGGEDEADAEAAAAERAESAAKVRKVFDQVSSFMHAVHGPCVGFAKFDSLDEVAAGVLVDPGADRAAFEGWVDQFLESMFADAPKETTTYESVELRLYEVPSSESDDEELFVYFEHAGTCALVLAPKREIAFSVAHGVIDRQRKQDGAQGVLGNPRFQAARASGDSKARIELFVDVARFIEIGMRDDPPDDESRKEMDLIGVQELSWARAVCDIGQGEQLDLELAFGIPKQGALARIFSHLRPCSEAFVRSIPRDAISVGTFGLDIAGLWNEGWEIAAELSPEGTAAARKQFDGAGEMLGGVDLEADLIEQFSGDIASFTVAVPDEEYRAALGAAFELMPEEAREVLERAPKVGNAFVIGLRDGKVVEGCVEKLLDASGMGASIEIEEFQGDTVNLLEIPGAGTRFSWVFQDRRVVISQYPTALRALLSHKPDAEGGSLYQHARWGPHLGANKGAAMLSLAGTPESLKSMGTAFQTLGAILPSNPATSLFTTGWPSPEAIDRLFSGTMLMSLTRTPSLLSLRMATR